jgi:monoterpene epsilon-lactone hydrolase
MASDQLRMIVDMLRSGFRREDVGFDEMRAELEAMSAGAMLPEGTRCEPVVAAGVRCEWVDAPSAAADAAILYLHGGGYVVGSLNSHRAHVARLSAACAARGLAVDYRLAPEHPHPAAVDDAVAAYRWLLDRGVAPSRIVIAGDSAGGGLTVATLVALRDAGDPLPSCGVCISPWTDLTCTAESMTTRAAVDPMVKPDGLRRMAAAYLAGGDLRAPLASPLYAQLRGLPPLLIHVGTAETLLDDSTRLADRARAAGVDVTLEVWDDMIHVWHCFAPMLPEADQAVARVGEYVRARLR